MANVVVFDPEFTGMFSIIEEETIEERISCFRRLRKAKHHKVITVNDLIKMFGFPECAAENFIEVDDLLGLDVVNYDGVDAMGGKHYVLNYCAGPIYYPKSTES